MIDWARLPFRAIGPANHQAQPEGLTAPHKSFILGFPFRMKTVLL